VRIVARSPTKVELEIDGERVVVEGWPEPFAPPPNEVAVDGERWQVETTLERSARASGSLATPAAPVEAVRPAAASSAPGPGTPVVPPMPGRVVELKVKEGERVRQGAVLLVLEAMKMRNEVTSPADGVVRDVRVSEGSNVRAREPMLFIAPA
jgi:glutaconyl-CoA/methylmalonyl-CoA decarboxylase subunit gamma